MRRNQKPVDALTPFEAHAVADHMKNYRYGDLYRLLFLAGCNLGLHSIDLINLHVGLFDAGEGTIIEQRTGKPRNLVFNSTLRRLYNEFRYGTKSIRIRREMFQSTLIFWNEDLCLSATTHAAQMHPSAFRRVIADSCASLGLPGNYGGETMRKTFARELFRQTQSIAVVRETLMLTQVDRALAYLETIPKKFNERADYTAAEIYECVAFE